MISKISWFQDNESKKVKGSKEGYKNYDSNDQSEEKTNLLEKEYDTKSVLTKEDSKLYVKKNKNKKDQKLQSKEKDKDTRLEMSDHTAGSSSFDNSDPGWSDFKKRMAESFAGFDKEGLNDNDKNNDKEEEENDIMNKINIGGSERERNKSNYARDDFLMDEKEEKEGETRKKDKQSDREKHRRREENDSEEEDNPVWTEFQRFKRRMMKASKHYMRQHSREYH